MGTIKLPFTFLGSLWNRMVVPANSIGIGPTLSLFVSPANEAVVRVKAMAIVSSAELHIIVFFAFITKIPLTSISNLSLLTQEDFVMLQWNTFFLKIICHSLEHVHSHLSEKWMTRRE
ncbi:hypothetical protein D3C73_809620 [compost metagenome]